MFYVQRNVWTLLQISGAAVWGCGEKKYLALPTVGRGNGLWGDLGRRAGNKVWSGPAVASVLNFFFPRARRPAIVTSIIDLFWAHCVLITKNNIILVIQRKWLSCLSHSMRPEMTDYNNEIIIYALWAAVDSFSYQQPDKRFTYDWKSESVFA